ncbi:IS200/IS605 family transposase [Parasutterella excrementihominis]|uniref:IS200/IS605 family transposase n=2 Tax=Parasutterella excrementihominis TaxID=487175 RepID=UPI00345E4A33
MAGLPISIVFTNNVSLDFLNHMQLSTGSHCVFNLKAHLIFVVAYRRKVISSTILERLKEIFSEVCQRDRVRLLECSGEEDHVHVLISYPPTICLSNLVQKLKTISSLKIRQEFFNQIRRMLWGKRFWTKSYFLISVRNGATTAIIKRYIKINGRIDIRPSAIHPRAYARGIPRN